MVLIPVKYCKCGPYSKKGCNNALFKKKVAILVPFSEKGYNNGSYSRKMLQLWSLFQQMIAIMVQIWSRFQKMVTIMFSISEKNANMVPISRKQLQ